MYLAIELLDSRKGKQAKVALSEVRPDVCRINIVLTTLEDNLGLLVIPLKIMGVFISLNSGVLFMRVPLTTFLNSHLF